MTFPKQTRIEDRALLDTYHAKNCAVCGRRPPSDPSHIRGRGAGGPDVAWNVVPMCRVHHTEWHQIGWSHFMNRYPPFKRVLDGLGWAVADGKLWHPSLATRKG